MKPLGIGEIVDLAVNIYVRNWRTLLRIALTVMIPVTLAIIALDVVRLKEVPVFDPGAGILQYGDGHSRIVDKDTFNLVAYLDVLLLSLGYLAVSAACFRAVGDAYLGREVDARSSLGFGLRKFHSVLWVSLMYSVLVGLGFLLVLPGIWLSIALVFAVPVLIFEGIKGRKAIDRSFNLASDNWWRSFATLLIGFVLIGILQIGAPLALRALMGSVDNAYLFEAGQAVSRGLSAVLSAPFYAALLTVLYYDLRVRKEGYDVQLLAQDLDSDAASRGPTGSVAPPPQTA